MATTAVTVDVCPASLAISRYAMQPGWGPPPHLPAAGYGMPQSPKFLDSFWAEFEIASVFDTLFLFREETGLFMRHFYISVIHFISFWTQRIQATVAKLFSSELFS